MTTSILDIETLIPHRDRMKLISDVLEINAEAAVTSSLVTDRWPLCRGRSVDPIVLIEIVAQTSGVYINWIDGVRLGTGGRGWLVGIKSADFFLDRIPIHTVLITTVKKLYGSENYNALEGVVTAGSDIVGRVQIQVFKSESG
jgi:predicted hotdog family 3-hydroxylacyl-ACP dehydratase